MREAAVYTANSSAAPLCYVRNTLVISHIPAGYERLFQPSIETLNMSSWTSSKLDKQARRRVDAALLRMGHMVPPWLGAHAVACARAAHSTQHTPCVCGLTRHAFLCDAQNETGAQRDESSSATSAAGRRRHRFLQHINLLTATVWRQPDHLTAAAASQALACSCMPTQHVVEQRPAVLLHRWVPSTTATARDYNAHCDVDKQTATLENGSAGK